MSSLAVDKDVLWYSREKDATWLAARLRSSRLTILEGQSGSGKTILLRWGVLPRLRRRATDPAATLAAPARRLPEDMRPDDEVLAATRHVVIPFPDRRRPKGTGPSARDTEIVVYVDSWGDAPLVSLQAALHEALNLLAPIGNRPPLLVDMLTTWHRQHGVRFLFVLDDFDECLKASVSNEGAREFVDQWVQTLSHPLSPAHFLIAMSEPAEPLWQLLGQHLATLGELDPHRLRLAGVSLASPPKSAPRSGPSLAASSTANVVSPDDEPVSADSLLDITLDIPPELLPDVPARPTPAGRAARTAGAGAGAQGTSSTDPLASLGRYRADDIVADRSTGPVDLDLADFTASVQAAIARADERPLQPPRRGSPLRIDPRRNAPRRSRVSVVAWSLAGLAVLAAAGFLVWDGTSPLFDRKLAGLAPGGASPSLTGPIAAGSLPAPGFELVADAGDSSDDMVISELAQLLTPAGHAAPTIRFPFGWAAAMSALSEQPRMTIATNDVLQAARRVAGGPKLQVLTPLFSEEIYFVVRSDSRLKYIHQIRSARINAGPARGGRAATANGVYEDMFGRSIPVRQLNAASREDAIEQLLAGKSVDVVVLVGAQPDPWLKQLSPQAKRGLRLLELDPNSVVSRKATVAYPTTRVAMQNGVGVEGPGGTHTLSTMAYLVAGDNGAPGAADAQITDAVTAFCRNLQALQGKGHPKWREFRPGVAETGWPNSAAAAKAFGSCAK